MLMKYFNNWASPSNEQQWVFRNEIFFRFFKAEMYYETPLKLTKSDFIYYIL